MLNALRLVEGFENSLFSERCGLSDQVLKKAVDEAVQLGLLNDSHKHLKPTEKGLQFHNDLQALFLDVDTSFKQSIQPDIHF